MSRPLPSARLARRLAFSQAPLQKLEDEDATDPELRRRARAQAPRTPLQANRVASTLHLHHARHYEHGLKHEYHDIPRTLSHSRPRARAAVRLTACVLTPHRPYLSPHQPCASPPLPRAFPPPNARSSPADAPLRSCAARTAYLIRLLESTAASTSSSATASAITDALHCNTPTAS
ncbi:hypothetical protein C8J57DRAFT_1525093 [Mycena rebaudengoi]|nr:hypothetical protein C8J57DRAFT_1525093 [Mycena rebaudengoi]